MKALTVLAVKDPGRFDHALSRARKDRDPQATHDQAVAALTAEGVTVAEDDTYVRLDRLTHDGEPLTPEAHAECPGHVAAVSLDWDDEAVVEHGCSDPAATATRTGGPTPPPGLASAAAR